MDFSTAPIKVTYAPSEGYARQKIPLALSRRQAWALDCLWQGARKARLTFINDRGEHRPVINRADAIRALLDVIDTNISEHSP